MTKNTAAILICFIFTNSFCNWGGYAISKELFNYVRTILPEGKTILELGSGWGTGQLAKHYTVYSIENSKQWLNKYQSTYIYAPIVNNWYDTQVLKRNLPEHYDLIFVDGPTGRIGRIGFFYNLELFNTNVPIIFDDTHRTAEYQVCIKVAEKLGREYTIIKPEKGNSFGVIMPSD